MLKKVVLIGGGAAGFFCAANLDENKFSVKILEQNKDVLQKVKISGGGRFNVSHACFDPKELVQFYPRGNKELLSVFTKFQPGDTMEWFLERNIALKIENDGRIFHESNSSQTIIDCFLKEIQQKNFEIHTQTSVKEIQQIDDQYVIKTNNGDFEADFVIFTTGSSPKSLKLVENMGHQLVESVQSLFTFNIQDSLLEGLSGTSFEFAEIKIPQLKTDENGPLLITQWGLSGPAILKTSAWKARELFELNYQFEIEVNFIAKTIYEAEALFMEFRQNNPKKTIGQSKILMLRTVSGTN